MFLEGLVTFLVHMPANVISRDIQLKIQDFAQQQSQTDIHLIDKCTA
jgi:hypothetical protein